MAEIVFPEGIKYVLSRLENAGFSAFAVGGCIRDSLLGRTPGDWDAASSARPEQVMELFGESALPTGLRHGTVTVKTPGGSVEVTTFRADGAYADHRRPDSVRFVGDIREDLSRRDFTVNAMAAPLSGEIVDPFDGRGDLARGLVRCVGEPERRFEEDALRMFRALRFCARLGFALDGGTRSAVFEKSHLAAELAAERVRVEIIKTLPCPCSRELGIMLDSGLLDAFCAPGGPADFSPLEALPGLPLPRLAGFCALLERGGRVHSAEFLRALKCSGKEIRLCSLGAGEALDGLPDSPAGWKRLLHRVGVDAARAAAAVGQALYGRDFAPEL
ncbi:MAG: tRNA nucleotidyltransferase, partial [Butyricicoccus sp.]|nr:tRNA nucleotidyltransferase [Butyricicoccus sp.]